MEVVVLHITPHLGSGVGRVLSGLAINSAKTQIRHIIVTLERTQDELFTKILNENNISVFIANECNLEKLLIQADIVQLDWWHHPLTSKFMFDYLGKVKTRLLIWSHISGCNYPIIPTKLVKYPDEFVFATPYSYENKSWNEEDRSFIRENSNLVVSSGLSIKKAVNKNFHNTFNIGYMGFLSYNKINHDFIKYCEAVSDIPNVKFLMVGDKSFGKELICDSSKSKLLDGKIEFTGYSTDVLKSLADFDILGYLLSPDHYGASENALLEAMAAGVVPVVLNQGCEKYIVKDMETGLLVNSIDQYEKAIKWLYNNPKELKRLGENASNSIIKKYSIETTVRRMNYIYEKMLSNEKTYHNAINVIGKTPYEWFISCYRGDVHNLKGNAFAETKGSARHYLKYFPYDMRLRRIVELNKK